MTSLGKRLIKAANAAAYKVFVPAKLDVKAIRAKTGLTQEEFSFGFSN